MRASASQCASAAELVFLFFVDLSLVGHVTWWSATNKQKTTDSSSSGWLRLYARKMNPIVKFGAWLTYIFLHLVIPLYSCLRWRLLPLTIQYLQYFLFYGLDGITLRGVKQTSRELGKVPEHIAFVFDERNPTIVSSTGLKRISSLICWAIAAGIPHISLFDSKGTNISPH